MNFEINRSVEILRGTPAVLRTLLAGLSDEWVTGNEGPDTFSPFDVVGHLLHGEKTDWTTRAKIILGTAGSKVFEPYDRFAMYEESRGKNMINLLDEFQALRMRNLEWLASLQLTDETLAKTGIHPTFGPVTLQQLLATWVVHDLTHISQITRVMAKQYTEEIGPWVDFFRILKF